MLDSGAAHGARPGARLRRRRPHARKDTAIVEELYDHTIDVILRAEALGGWRALDQRHIFDVEYWDLEQAKLRKGGAPPVFTGEVALVTGAASGIGKACVEAFLKRGAAVVGLDLNPAIETHVEARRLPRRDVRPDRRQRPSTRRSMQRCKRFGGVDMLVLNAGIFPSSQPIQRHRRRKAGSSAMTVNVEAQPARHAGLPSAAQARAARRPRRGHRLEERAGARARRRAPTRRRRRR